MLSVYEFDEVVITKMGEVHISDSILQNDDELDDIMQDTVDEVDDDELMLVLDDVMR